MNNGVDHEIPDAYRALVPISVDLVVVHRRVRDQLNKLAALERHLLLEQLVLHLRRPSLGSKLTGIPEILVPELVGVFCDTRPKVVSLVQLDLLLGLRVKLLTVVALLQVLETLPVLVLLIPQVLRQPIIIWHVLILVVQLTQSILLILRPILIRVCLLILLRRGVRLLKRLHSFHFKIDF